MMPTQNDGRVSGGSSFYGLRYTRFGSCDEAREADLVRIFVQGVYQPDFQALKQHFAGWAGTHRSRSITSRPPSRGDNRHRLHHRCLAGSGR